MGDSFRVLFMPYIKQTVGASGDVPTAIER